MITNYKPRSRSIEKQYVEADTSFLINFGSKNLKPIRISTPKPPRLNYIHGYGLPPSDQYFKRLKIPEKITDLEKECYEYYKGKKGITIYDIQEMFWHLIGKRKNKLKPEIAFMKHYRWYMHHGYWFFNDGKPTYITGWQFSYLNMHFMTLRKGEGYPEYDERQRRRFLYRKYLYETTETFADLDDIGRAIKVDGKYRIKDLGIRTFFGPIEPKGRREGLTNEFCHIVTRVMSETRGSDNLGTIVSMDGDNAGTHFKKKLVPAFKKWPLWTQPIWKGGITEIEFASPKSALTTTVKPLASSINYTDSASDTKNDGKKIMAAGYDEQGKGKRIGNVGNRWQINKETMSQEAGSDILGFCTHPSTVEKMEEGGQDYKEMCQISDFYTRDGAGQTYSGLAISYMPTSFCLRGFTDKFGNPVLLKPTKRQIYLGYPKDIGSKAWVARRRLQLYDEGDAKKRDEYRSFVRKFPEDYDDCWKGVAGFIGFPVEKIEERVLELENNPTFTRGRLDWINNQRFGKVEFIDDPQGEWFVSRTMKPNESNLITTMEYYSAYHDQNVLMFRPLFPENHIIGVDPHEFNNKGESAMLKSKYTKLSDTGITVLRRRDKTVDTNDFDKKSWKSKMVVAALQERFATNESVAEESIKAALYWGGLIHLERNKTEVWSHIIKWKYGGFLNHMAELSPDGRVNIDPNPGSFVSGSTKKKMFTLAKDHFMDHIQNESILPLLKQALSITSMEELTKYDLLASFMNALIGDTSLYPEIMKMQDGDDDVLCLGITGKAI